MVTAVGQVQRGGVTGAAGAAPARFDAPVAWKTSVTEASDVVALPGGLLALVSDERDAIHLIDADQATLDPKGRGHRGERRPEIDAQRRETKLTLPGVHGPSGFEAIAYDPFKHRLFASREEKREVLRWTWKPGGAAPVLEKRIDFSRLGGPQNKGIEGLTYLPRRFSPTGAPQLLAAKEGVPRELVMLRRGGKGDPQRIELDRQVTDALKDFSALAVDPRSGDLFLSSDRSAIVAQVRLVRDGTRLRARLVQALPLKLPRIEGLTFDARGNMYVLTENDGTLHVFKRR